MICLLLVLIILGMNMYVEDSIAYNTDLVISVVLDLDLII